MMKSPYILCDSQIFDLQKFGGISRYFCEIISRLNIKYDISVRYTENHYLKNSKLSKHFLYLPHFIFKRYEWKLYRKNRKLTKRILQSTSPYLFHPTYYDPYFLEYIGNNPFVVTVHDMIYELFPQYFNDSKEIISQKREIITKANRIIAISENTKKDIIDILNIDPLKIDVIYHGTSIQTPCKKNKLQLPQKYILFVGDRVTYKNFQRLLEAFAILAKTDKELVLICTGKPFSRDEKEKALHLNVSTQIMQIPIDDKKLNELYARALLFVYPSLYEGFGIPILEAYSCNCPVALSKASCFPEIAGDAGAYFDPYCIESIANTISDCIYNEEKRIELIKKGKERLKLYSWEKAAQETEAVYQKVLSEI